MKTANTISITGLLYALAIIPATVILWVVVWHMGFIASIVSFLTVVGAVWLYKLGSKGVVSKRAAVVLLVIMIVAVGLAFLGGVAYDVYDVYKFDVDPSAGVFDAGFIEYYFIILGDSDFWNMYANDLIMSLVFVLLGAGFEIKNLFLPPKLEGEDRKEA